MTNAQTTSNPVIHSLNWLRGLASLLVCLFHFKLYIWKDESNNAILQFLDKGHFGVIMFFIISGFVIPYSMYVKKYEVKSFFKYLLKRSVRIEPPYIATILLCFAWGFYCQAKIWGGEFHVDWKQFFLNITYLAPFTHTEWINIIFWTLAVEFQFYILTGLIFNLLMKNKFIRYLLFGLIIALGFVIPDSYRTVFNVYIFFVVGFQCFLFFVKEIKLPEFVFSIVLAVVFVYFFEQVAGIPYVIFTVLGVFLLNFKTKISEFFGDISYSLYLIHGLIGGTIVLFTKDLPRSFLLGVCVFNAIVCAYIFFRLIEQPFLRLSKKLKY